MLVVSGCGKGSCRAFWDDLGIDSGSGMIEVSGSVVGKVYGSGLGSVSGSVIFNGSISGWCVIIGAGLEVIG